MTIIIDIIVLAILLGNIIVGYKRGLTGSIIKIISFFIALLIALGEFK